MTGNDAPSPNPPPPNTPLEERLLRRFRVISVTVILAMIVLLATADTLGRLLVSPQFHASELIFGTLVGALLALLGIEIVNRIPGGRNGNGK